MTKLYSWIFLLLLIALRRVQAGGVITTPPINTSICYGGLATFHCGSDRNDIAVIEWKINSEEVTNESKKFGKIMISTMNGNNSKSSTLSILGQPIKSVGCTAVTNSYDIDTVPATLAVYDIPPVEHLTIEFNDTVMNVSWNKPSCLPVYYVYSITITDDNNQTLTTNTTDPLYTMPVWSNCTTNYTVSVTVIDTGYTHKQSVPAVQNGLSNNAEEINISMKNIEIRFVDKENCYIDIVYQIEKHCPGRSMIDVSYELTVQTSDVEGSKGTFNFFEDSVGYNTVIIGPFSKRFIGTLFLKLVNLDIVVNISSFNVQRFVSEPLSTNGVVQFTCFFANNSSATGCVVKLPNLQLSYFIPKFFNTNNATDRFNITIDGLHLVLVYDNIDEYIVPTPAIRQTITVSYTEDDIHVFSNSTAIHEAQVTSTATYSTFPMTINPPSHVSTIGLIIGIIIFLLAVAMVIVICVLCIHFRKREEYPLNQEEIPLTMISTSLQDTHDWNHSRELLVTQLLELLSSSSRPLSPNLTIEFDSSTHVDLLISFADLQALLMHNSADEQPSVGHCPVNSWDEPVLMLVPTLCSSNNITRHTVSFELTGCQQVISFRCDVIQYSNHPSLISGASYLDIASAVTNQLITRSSTKSMVVFNIHSYCHSANRLQIYRSLEFACIYESSLGEPSGPPSNSYMYIIDDTSNLEITGKEQDDEQLSTNCAIENNNETQNEVFNYTEGMQVPEETAPENGDEDAVCIVGKFYVYVPSDHLLVTRKPADPLLVARKPVDPLLVTRNPQPKYLKDKEDPDRTDRFSQSSSNNEKSTLTVVSENAQRNRQPPRQLGRFGQQQQQMPAASPPNTVINMNRLAFQGPHDTDEPHDTEEPHDTDEPTDEPHDVILILDDDFEDKKTH